MDHVSCLIGDRWIKFEDFFVVRKFPGPIVLQKKLQSPTIMHTDWFNWSYL